MDPDANLEELLKLAKENEEASVWDDSVEMTDSTRRMCELVQALDRWLVSGGFPPKRWRNGR